MTSPHGMYDRIRWSASVPSAFSYSDSWGHYPRFFSIFAAQGIRYIDAFRACDRLRCVESTEIVDTLNEILTFYPEVTSLSDFAKTLKSTNPEWYRHDDRGEASETNLATTDETAASKAALSNKRSKA